jgi:hypothetical protein
MSQPDVNIVRKKGDRKTLAVAEIDAAAAEPNRLLCNARRRAPLSMKTIVNTTRSGRR